MKITNHLEKRVAEILNRKGITFVSANYSNGIDQKLDFYIPESNVYIEVKQYHSERTSRQLASQDNIILIQGEESIKFLETLIKSDCDHPYHSVIGDGEMKPAKCLKCGKYL